MGTHLRATQRHLPYGSTQRNLPPDTGERTLHWQINSSWTCTRFTYPAGIKGWVDLGGWLVTFRDGLPVHSHPSKYSSNHLIVTRLSSLLQSVVSSSSSCWSCIKLPVNRVTGHLRSRCSTVCGCCPQWLQVDCFLCPMHLCKVCVVLHWPVLSWFMKTHSPRGSAGSLSPGSGR